MLGTFSHGMEWMPWLMNESMYPITDIWCLTFRNFKLVKYLYYVYHTIQYTVAVKSETMINIFEKLDIPFFQS